VYSSDFPISVSLASSVSEKFKGTSIYFSCVRTELHQENDRRINGKYRRERERKRIIFQLNFDSCFLILVRIPLAKEHGNTNLPNTEWLPLLFRSDSDLGNTMIMHAW
jgi:hypothetical protein